MNILEIKQLQKAYPGFSLEGLDLALPGGSILGLIGENGAGKSTTIKMILDMVHPEGGSITLFGQDISAAYPEAREHIGVVLDEVGLPLTFNLRQVGGIMAGIYRTWDPARYDRLVKQLNLPEDKPYKDFSRGMKMKLGFAIALSHDSRLLLLDEATSGLDPVVREEILDMLMDFAQDEGHAVLISSHIVSDLEKVCDYIAFLHQGKLMLMEEKDLLLSQYGLLHCTREQLETIPEEAVRHVKANPYGVQAMVLRSGVPAGMSVSPISIEELFIFMVKEAK